MSELSLLIFVFGGIIAGIVFHAFVRRFFFAALLAAATDSIVALIAILVLTRFHFQLGYAECVLIGGTILALPITALVGLPFWAFRLNRTSDDGIAYHIKSHYRE
jgi:hypothetical protein